MYAYIMFFNEKRKNGTMWWYINEMGGFAFSSSKMFNSYTSRIVTFIMCGGLLYVYVTYIV